MRNGLCLCRLLAASGLPRYSRSLQIVRPSPGNRGDVAGTSGASQCTMAHVCAGNRGSTIGNRGSTIGNPGLAIGTRVLAMGNRGLASAIHDWQSAIEDWQSALLANTIHHGQSKVDDLPNRQSKTGNSGAIVDQRSAINQQSAIHDWQSVIHSPPVSLAISNESDPSIDV